MHVDELKQPGTERLEFRIPGVNSFRIPLFISRPNTPFSSTLLLVYGFSFLIILGAILLILPVSSASGQLTSPLEAFFTAVSAVCLTGLVVVDTGTHWSFFGQVVILALIQLGGFGFITGTTLLLMAIGGRLGLRDRLFASESAGIDRLGGVLGVIIRIAIFSLILETIGAVIFYFQWSATGAQGVSLWTAIFHAVSAFNNSGMDLFGNFKSLVDFRVDSIFLLTTAVLIIFGSTGYVVVEDFFRHGRFRKLSLDSKIVLVTSFSLLVLGTVFYLVAESTNQATLEPLSAPQKIVLAFFQSVTPRTAGFSAVDMGSLTQIALFFTMFLMFIGGASGSTAGGLKVNTVGVLAITVMNVIKGNENVNAFGSQLPRQTVFRAFTLFLVYLGLASLVILILSITEAFPMDKILFESLSALGTVGLSTGITPDLSTAGQIVITIVMFLGRLAPLTFMAYLTRHHAGVNIDYPRENVRLG